MRLALLALILLSGCERTIRDRAVRCDDCFNYDGYWKTSVSVIETRSSGSVSEQSGEMRVIIDQLQSGAISFEGVPAQADEVGLYFDSAKSYDDPVTGLVTGTFSGGNRTEPHYDPWAIELSVLWEFESGSWKRRDFTFVLEELVYE